MTTTHFNTEHIVMSSNQPYDQVIQALEAQLGQGNELEAVFQHVYESQASWEQVTQSIEPLVGSSGFLIFSKLDDTVLLSLAGKPTKARLYPGESADRLSNDAARSRSGAVCSFAARDVPARGHRASLRAVRSKTGGAGGKSRANA